MKVPGTKLNLLYLFFVLTFLSCTKSIDESCGPIELPAQAGKRDLVFSVSGQQESTPQTRHGVPTPGTDDENLISSLHVFIFDDAGDLESREVINIDATNGTATDAFTGQPHPGWLGGDRRKLRVSISQGEKTIAVVANWRTDGRRDPEFPPIRDVLQLSELNEIVRRHFEQPLPTNPPVMCGVKNITVDDSQADLPINLERQIARVDFYPAITNQLKLMNVEVKITGVKFNKLAGAAYLTYHTNGGSPAEPVSPPNYYPTYDYPTYTDTPQDVITITNPAAPNAVRYATHYIPEWIASGEEEATEMVLRALYNGRETYYGVKLHNGKSGSDKRFWVERNHLYRYNITITGIGSGDGNKPDFSNVIVGVSNDDWLGGESTTPDVGFELPQGAITVMHFKGISRFMLGTSKEYGVGSNANWISARRITEGNGANARTYLEIMTRTNTTATDRTGTVDVVLPNGLTQTLTVNQLSEANSVWKNPTDGVVWYRANVGAARIEDPGFMYQWGRNVAYSPYTPVEGVVPGALNPLHSYGAVNWNEIPQIFPQELPVIVWNSSWSTDVAEWSGDINPCPQGYRLPNYSDNYNLIKGDYAPVPAWVKINGIEGCWLNGTSVPTDLTSGIFLPLVPNRYTSNGATGHANIRNKYYYWQFFRKTQLPRYMDCIYISKTPSIISLDAKEMSLGGSARCVKAGNVRYNGNGADGGSITDNRSYAASETVTTKNNAYTKAGHTFDGWEVLNPDGSVLHASLAAGATFQFPANTEYVTVRAKWRLLFVGTYNMNGANETQMAPQYKFLGENWVDPGVTLTRAGHRFIGWEASTGIHWGSPAVSNVTFTAKWVKVAKVDFVSNGVLQTTLYGDVDPTNATLILPAAPTNGDGIFQGWQVPRGGANVFAPGSAHHFEGDETWTAKWALRVRVTFDPGAGTLSDPSLREQEGAPGTPINVPSADLENYVLVGWRGLPNPAVFHNPPVDGWEARIFTPIWKPREWTTNFTKGGKVVATQTKLHGTPWDWYEVLGNLARTTGICWGMETRFGTNGQRNKSNASADCEVPVIAGWGTPVFPVPNQISGQPERWYMVRSTPIIKDATKFKHEIPTTGKYGYTGYIDDLAAQYLALGLNPIDVRRWLGMSGLSAGPADRVTIYGLTYPRSDKQAAVLKWEYTRNPQSLVCSGIGNWKWESSFMWLKMATDRPTPYLLWFNNDGTNDVNQFYQLWWLEAAEKPGRFIER